MNINIVKGLAVKMNNSEFLQIIKESFLTCLNTIPRSNEKLKILHSAISVDVKTRLNDNKYALKSLGYGTGQEQKVKGRYVDKAVDITILENGTSIAGIAVKFVMSNYSQNSNNYFENMLGETANIRCARIPYYQVFIIPDKVPYYDKANYIKHWEKISEHNLSKYINLSHDNIDMFLHTPNKTFIGIIHLSCDSDNIRTKQDYSNYYLNNDFEVTYSTNDINFGNSIIYNNYELFAEKVTNGIKSL